MKTERMGKLDACDVDVDDDDDGGDVCMYAI